MPEKLDSSIVLLRERIEQGMRGSADLILDEFELAGVKGLAFMFDGLVSNTQVSDFLLRPINRMAPPEADPENGLAFSAAVPADRKRRPSALPCLPRFLCSTLRGRPIAVCRTSDASPERRPRAGPAEGPCPFCLNAFSEQSAAWLCSLYIMPRRQCQ